MRKAELPRPLNQACRRQFGPPSVLRIKLRQGFFEREDKANGTYKR